MFSELFDSIPDALIVVDGKGCIVIANPQAERMFGYPPSGLVGLRVEELMPETIRERHRAHQAAYVANPRVRAMGDTGQALTGQRLDGQLFPVEIALSPIVGGGETRYLASIRDVSETQRVRQALVRASYDTLVARIGQLALESVGEESVIQVVPAMLAEALSAETVALAFVRPPGDGVEVRAAFGAQADWGDCERALATFNTPLWDMLANGSPLVVEDAASPGGGQSAIPMGKDMRSGVAIPMLDRDRPMGALIALSRRPHRFDHDALHLLQSVAHLLAALMQRRRTEEQLAHSQRLEAIGQLTGGIAHDFNNLLTIMSGSLQLLELEYPQHPGAAELIASALRSVTRGAELTAKLLAFARRQRLNPQAIHARPLLRDLELMLQRTLGESIRIEVECDDALPCAYADTTQLDTALVNLALNARDAMPRGGVLTLSVSERWVSPDETLPELASGHYVVFSVADTGHGMNEDTLARAVEPFFTTKDVGRGSGLGLSMVYGFVRQSGGYIRFDSELGYGTRVDLFLPVAKTTADTAQSIAAETNTGAGQTVLVVEDEPAVRDISAAFLRSLGYRVHAVGNAAEALQMLAHDDTIALLFSDVMLGDGMDGNELARAARRRRPELQVLLTSGYEDSVARQDPLDADRFELLRKPFRREQLAAAARRSLARRTRTA
jgi:PAS domain S-box-containing protein